MADPILIFPRTIYSDVDPSVNDNTSRGYIDGNIWINQSSGKSFICTDSVNGGWVTILTSGGSGVGGDFTFGDGLNSDVEFNLGNGDFIVSSDNLFIDDESIAIKGNKLVYNSQRQDVATAKLIAQSETIEQDGELMYNHLRDEWQAGEYGNLNPIVTTKLDTRDPLPEDNWETGHYLGMTWINKVTRQKFTCVSCPLDDSPAVWVLALSTAPVTLNVQTSDHLILYNADDQKYSKISYNNFMEYVAGSLGGFMPAIPEYSWQLDTTGNISPSEEPEITKGLLRADAEDNVTPLESPQSDVDEYFELDVDDNVTPKTIPTI